MMLINRAVFVLVLFLFNDIGLYSGSGATLAFAQEQPGPQSDQATLKEGFESLNTSLEEIKKELQLIRRLLSQRPL